jgi:hypothetical protein
MSNLAIFYRKKRLHLNDHRCYSGAYFDAEYVWGPWEILESMRFLKPGTDPEDRLKFWRELNDYAVSQRGERARSEFKVEVVPEEAA